MLNAKRALLSVSDKSGLADFGRGLADLGIELLSTGGTFKHLEDAGVPVTKVSEVTGSPEILDGRVKTLHPRIHGGILADRSRSSHLSELREHGIEPIDLVVVNLYPFRETAAAPDATYGDIVEMIDIGGPCMLRAAAKNHQGVVVVVDPADYPQILTALQEGEGTVPESLRQSLALKGFRHTQAYDTAIARWLEEQLRSEDNVDTTYPEALTLELAREMVPRYGENPHQRAAVYRDTARGGILGNAEAGFQQLQGKELSWNNFLDADAARKLVWSFDEPTVVIVKHNNPCGTGRGETLETAYERALRSDPVSAFGSIVAINRPATVELATAMKDLFVEVVVAPGYEEAAIERFARKKNLRVLRSPAYAATSEDFELRAIDGGFLAQSLDVGHESPDAWTCPTRAQPTDSQWRALDFVWRVGRYVKSNAIVIGGPDQTYGVGAGQMSRLDSARIALEKTRAATEDLGAVDLVASSDAFFPFRDGLDVLAEGGVRAIAQPGGSKRDDEVIAAADEHGIAMVFTGRRHFRH